MGRRAKGEGSIVQRADGRWMYTIEIPASGINGKRSRRYFYGKTRAAAIAKAQDERARGGGSLVPTATGTVREWVETWLRDTIKPNRSPNTFAIYSTMWGHADELIGSVKLKDFDVQHVEQLVEHLRKTKRPSVPAKVVNVLKAAFSMAIKRKRYAFANPFIHVEVRAPRAKEGRALSVAEAKAFLKAARGTDFEALWVLLLTTGFRLGEALALEWRDVDLRKHAVVVRQSLSEVGGICEVREPKTRGSRRRVELGPLAIAALRARRPRNADGFVFTSSTGGHPRRSNLRLREFAPICARAKIGGLTIHGLRHSATSLALAQGAPVVAVAGMLGHRSTRLVQERYGHTIPTAHKDAALAVDRALKDTRRTK